MMDRMTSRLLSKLADVDQSGPAPKISIYAPMYQAGREVQQNSIRIKNLINAARERLERLEYEADQIDQWLSAAGKLVDDEDFWQHQSTGLAMFLADGIYDAYRLPCEFEERVVVGPEWHITPLTAIMSADHQWYVLAVSPKRIRLVQASSFGADNLDPKNFPKSLRDALNIDEYVSALQFHSTSNATQHGGDGAAIHHGHGGSDLDVKKQDELLQFFHRLNDALMDYLGNADLPLVFAGVEYLFPIFKETSDYPFIIPDPLTGSPDELSVQELQQRSFEIMEPKIQKRRMELLNLYDSRAHTNWATADLGNLWTAAQQGLIDTLLVNPAQHHWVRQSEGEWQASDADDAHALDLFNKIAVQTLRHSGQVVAIPSTAEDSAKFRIGGILRAPLESMVSSK